MDTSPPGSCVHGISQGRTGKPGVLQSWKLQRFEHDLVTEQHNKEYWSPLPFPSPGDLSNLEIEPWSPTVQVDCLLSEPPGKPSDISNHSDSVLTRIQKHHI